jgi:hypothetical protein
MKTKFKILMIALFISLGIKAQMLTTSSNSYGGCSWGTGGLEGTANALIPIKTGMGGTNENKFVFVLSDSPFGGRRPTVTILNENMTVWKTVSLSAVSGAPNAALFNKGFLIDACKFPLGVNIADETDPLNKVIAIAGAYKVDAYNNFVPFVFLFDWGKMIQDGPSTIANQYVGNIIKMHNWAEYSAVKGPIFASIQQYKNGNERYIVTYNNQYTLKKHSNCGSIAGFNTQTLNFFKHNGGLNLDPGASISMDNSMRDCVGNNQSVSHARDMKIVGDDIYLVSTGDVNASNVNINFWLTRCHLTNLAPSSQSNNISFNNYNSPLAQTISYSTPNHYFDVTNGSLFLEQIERRKIVVTGAKPTKLSIYNNFAIVSGTNATGGFLMSGNLNDIFNPGGPINSSCNFYNFGTVTNLGSSTTVTGKEMLGHELDDRFSNPIINFYGIVRTSDSPVSTSDNGYRFFYGQVRLNQLLIGNIITNPQGISFRQTIAATNIHSSASTSFPNLIVRDADSRYFNILCSGINGCATPTANIIRHKYNFNAIQNPACYAVSPTSTSCNQNSFGFQFVNPIHPSITATLPANINCSILNRTWSPLSAFAGPNQSTFNTTWLNSTDVLQSTRVMSHNGCSRSYCEPLQVNLSGQARLCDYNTETTLTATICQFGTNNQYTYQWYYNGTLIPNETGTSIHISPQGNYYEGSYYAIVTNQCGNFDASNVITVTRSYNLSVTASSDVAICGGTAAFTTLSGIASNGIAPYNYRWYLDGVLLASTPDLVINTASAQNLTYTLIVTDANGCSVSDDVNVLVNAAPIANAGSNLALCSDAVTNLNGTATDGTPTYTYLWSPSTGLDDASNNAPQISLNNATAAPITSTYTFTVTDANGCSASDAIDVTINPNPIADAGADMSQCSDIAGTLNGSVTGGTPAYTYVWSPITGLDDASSITPQIALNNATSSSITTTYTLTVSDANGCSAVDATDITINPNPIADAGADLSLCHDVASSLNGNVTGGTPAFSYVWNPSTGLDNPSSIAPQISLSNSGASPVTEIYSLSVTDANGCVGNDDVLVTTNPENVFEFVPQGWENGNLCQDPISIAVVENPDVIFVVEAYSGSNSQFVGSQYSSNGLYLWDIDWSVLQIGDNLTVRIEGVNQVTGCTSQYKFELTINCLNPPGRQMLTNTVNKGLKNLTIKENNFKLNAYPNPFSSNATFRVEGANNEKVNLELTDVNGKVVLNTNINTNTNFNFENYSIQDGIYFLKATTNNGEMSVLKVSKIK